jgi:hypothetical protein
MTWRTNCTLESAWILLMEYHDKDPGKIFLMGPPQEVDPFDVYMKGPGGVSCKYTLPGMTVEKLQELGLCGIYEDH